MKTRRNSRLWKTVGNSFSRFTEAGMKEMNFLVGNEGDIRRFSIGVAFFLSRP